MLGLVIVYKFDQPEKFTFTDLNIENVESEIDTINQKQISKERKEFRKQRFEFDPNTIGSDSLKLLGISQYAISNLLKYRAKGGKIKNVEQFNKIYGMEKHKGEFNDLLIFNESINDNLNNKEQKEYKNYNTEKQQVYDQIVSNKPIPIVRLKNVDINRADSFELQGLKGIGSVLAKRIIKYRDGLGGFYDVTQLEEVYGMTPQTFMDINHLIKIDVAAIKKINVNTADEFELDKHPYLTKKQSSIIIKYRNNHGNYNNFEDFTKVKIFTPEELEKLKYYLSY